MVLARVESRIEAGPQLVHVHCHGEIPRTPGHRWKVGEIELEVVRDAAPRKMLDMEIGDGARSAIRRRAGVICRVVVGGTLALGDGVTL